MARLPLLAGFLLLWGAQVCSQCTFSRDQQMRFNAASLKLRKEMGGDFPYECNTKTNIKKFPCKVMQDKHLQTHHSIQETIYSILHPICKILSRRNLDNTGWEFSIRNRFVDNLCYQVNVLGTCLSEDKEGKTSRSAQINNKKLRKYFTELERFLEKENYTRCAWEIFRLQMRDCLVAVDQLTGKI